MKTMALSLVLAGTAFAAWGEPTHVVEMFTSKYCPNCPAAEKKMMGIAGGNPDLLVMFAHVDYWDRGDQKDPYGLAEATQRQYDYSNSLSARPGQVFTPMPVIDGALVASPPLWLSWEGKVGQARDAGPLAKVAVRRSGSGGIRVDIPEKIYKKGAEVWVFGVEPVEGTQVRRVMRVGMVEAKKGGVSIARALAPTEKEVVVLVQEAGPGAVLGMGILR